MANDENLIPNSARTPKERRENAQKAGKASGVARRKKKQLRQMAAMLLSLDAKPQAQLVLSTLGVPDDEQTMGMAVVAQQLLSALGGNRKSAEFLMKYAGLDPRLEIEQEKLKLERDKLAAMLAADQPSGKTNNLLEVIRTSTAEDMDVNDISEIQQTADFDADMVESPEVQDI